MSSKKPRRNYKLPSDDHLVVPPVERDEEDVKAAVLLSHHWDLFSKKDKDQAILIAYWSGVQLATGARETGEEAYGDAKDYRRMCIRFAFEKAKVINDVEKELWRSVDPEDPRLVAFAKGFKDATKKLAG